MLDENHASLARHWLLDTNVDFLNHGSFGACPIPVLAAQAGLRERMERQPVGFFLRELEGLLDDARADLASFLDAEPQNLAFVANATTGVNTVLRSLPLRAGDELLTTNHAYAACKNALDYVAQRAGARTVVAEIPFPLHSEDQVVERVLAQVSSRTRLALLDHVTSPTALLLPLERLVPALKTRGVDTLFDGAHAPGMIDLSLRRLGAAYYTGNCHKWLCAPKSVAFLYVSPERQAEVRPLSISHGASSLRQDRSRFLLELDWTGTIDPSAALCVPDAIRFLASLVPGGMPEVRARNRALALRARDVLCEALNIPAPCPDSMLGSMAAVPLGQVRALPPSSHPGIDPLQDLLLRDHGVEVPVHAWPAPPARLLRVSAQLYNHESQYRKLAAILRDVVAGTHDDPRSCPV
jgi:isopenicillin-N epimerase